MNSFRSFEKSATALNRCSDTKWKIITGSVLRVPRIYSPHGWLHLLVRVSIVPTACLLLYTFAPPTPPRDLHYDVISAEKTSLSSIRLRDMLCTSSSMWVVAFESFVCLLIFSLNLKTASHPLPCCCCHVSRRQPPNRAPFPIAGYRVRWVVQQKFFIRLAQELLSYRTTLR